jgi:hypothetical protein
LYLLDDIQIMSETRCDGFEDHLAHAAQIQRFLDFGGQALAVGLTVVQDRDVLAAPVIRQVFTSHGTLQIVPAAEAEYVLEPLLSQQRVGRIGRDHQNAGPGVDLGCRDRGAGTLIADDDVDALGDQLVGGGHRLLARAIVVDFDQPDRLAEKTARRVQVGDRDPGAAVDRFAQPGIRAGIRGRQTDQDLGMGQRGSGQSR